MKSFFSDRWNVAWVGSALVLLLVVLLVPLDSDVGPWLVAAVALVVIVITSKLRIGDAKRDRELRAQRREQAGRGARNKHRR